MANIFHLSVPWWELVVRALIIYAVFFIGLRLFGRREIGQFTLFDLVVLLLVANALQPAITGPDTSVTGGVIIIAVLLLANRGIAMLRTRWPAFDHLIDPPPTVLAQDGKLMMSNIEKEGLSVNDVEMAIREHGVEKVDQCQLVVLENDGSISCVSKDNPGSYRRRRRVVRFLRK